MKPLLQIVFDDPNASYFAGQIVHGKILIHLSKPKKIKALKLHCSGRAEVHWTTGSGKHKKSRDANESYFVFDRVLLGEETRDMEIILPVGEKVFPFHIQLPQGLPSSFQGAHGNVQYFIRATITRPWKFSQKVSSYFTVNGFLDLNLLQHASRALTASKRKNVGSCSLLGCLGCDSATVEFQLTLDKTGFVPGDTVRFSLTALNESEHRISDIVIQLICVVTYRVRRHDKSERQVLATVCGQVAEFKRTITWNSDSQQPGAGLKIPAVPPTNLAGGSLISIQYFLVVTVTIATFCRTRMVGEVPIIIGTVPYRSSFEQLMPSTFVPRQPTAPAPSTPDEPVPSTADSQPISVTPLDFNCPPPTYADVRAPPTYAEAMELFSLYGTPAPSAPLAQSPENQLEGEKDEAGFGRPFNPRYASYDWDRVHKPTV